MAATPEVMAATPEVLMLPAPHLQKGLNVLCTGMWAARVVWWAMVLGLAVTGESVLLVGVVTLPAFVLLTKAILRTAPVAVREAAQERELA